MTYKFLSHTADVKFIAAGKNFEEMLKSASEALLESMKGNLMVKEVKEKDFEISGKDREEILYNFLEEFLFLLDAQGFVCSKILEIKFDEGEMKLKVKVVGGDFSEYDFTNEVKAITFNEMCVRQEGNKWECQVVLDV